MLTPQQIQQFNQATGNNVSPDAVSGIPSRADEIMNIGKSAPAQPGFLSSVASDIGNRAKAVGQNFTDSFSSGKGPIDSTLQAAQGGLRIAGDIAGGVNDVAGAAISKVAPGIPKAIQAIAGTEWGQGVAQRYQAYAQAHPDAAKDLESVFNIGSATATVGGGIEGVNKLVDVAPAIGRDLAQTGSDVADSVKSVLPKSLVAEPETLESSAIKDSTPSYSKKIIGEPAIQNADGTSTPRVSEAKGISTRTVNPSISETSAGKELAKVEGYDPKATALDKYNLVQKDIGTKAEALKSSLDNEGILRPPKEVKAVIRSAVNKAADESVLLQKADPAVKNYIRVANKLVDGNPGTLAGELQVRQGLDDAYESAGGKYGDNKALDQIHRAARNAVNEDMEANAQSTQVKASLKQQSDLYRASDILKDKAIAEGGSKLEQFANKHPIVAKAGKVASRLTGLDVITKHLP